MPGIRNNEAARQELQNLRATVGSLSRNSTAVVRDYGDSGRDLQSADSDVRDAYWPVQRAEQDTVKTDVSNEGWQLDRILNDCERQLQDSDRRLGDASQTSRTMNSDLDTGRNSFSRLRGLLSDRPDLLSDLERASGQYEGAANDHKSADNDAYWADNKGDSATRDLQSCDSYVWRIRSDRVGTDVSSDARMLDSRLNNVKWSVQDAKSSLKRADSEERRAGQGFDSTDQTLASLAARL